MMHSPDVRIGLLPPPPLPRYLPMFGGGARSAASSPLLSSAGGGEGRSSDTREKKFAKANEGVGAMMLSVSTTCPKCHHAFSLGTCGGAASTGSAGCRDGLALSGGGLLWPPTPSPTQTPSPSIFFFGGFGESSQQRPQPEQDLVRLRKADARLRLSGWYYEYLTWQQSQCALRGAAPGTFLVRDSSDHKFLYSLSVQTSKGPTSVRIHYDAGRFRLDAQPSLAPMMPQFDCVVRLVEHYVKVTLERDRDSGAKSSENSSVLVGNVWVNALGGPHSPVEVRKPLLAQPPKLAHVARTVVWKALRDAGPPAVLPLQSPIRRLGLPQPLQVYLEEYPYTC